MDVSTVLAALEMSSIAKSIRASLYFFPFLEAIHVMGLSLVFGTIAIVDLRLLGVAWTKRPFRRLASDTLKWTWTGFAIAAVTGALMFVSNAQTYFHNFPFQAKMVLMLLAGVNMVIFQIGADRTSHLWDQAPSAPTAGKIAAALSLALWISIVFMGRWIGFTSTQKANETPPPAAADVNFDDFLGGGDAPPAQPAPAPAPAAQ